MRAQAPLPPLLRPASSFNFPAKQTLTYAVDWRVFPAGTATFHLEQVGSMEHVIATGESIGAVNLLFRVNDRFYCSKWVRSACFGDTTLPWALVNVPWRPGPSPICRP